MFCASKGAKPFATLEVVRCGNVRFCTSLHAWTTPFILNGVQGVAGSNPAVPINCFSRTTYGDFGRRLSCVPSMNIDQEVEVLWGVGRNDPSEPQGEDRE